MGDLVHVVADAAQLREQGRVHSPIGWPGGHIDFADQDQLLAQPRNRQAKLLRLRRFQRVIVLGHANADHAAARSLRVRSSSRHRLRLIS